MTSDYLEYAIIAFIVVSIGVVVWRGGAANPEGTGALGRKVTRLDGDVGGLRGEVRGLRGDFDDVERRLGEIERTSAKASDIERVEKRLKAHGEKIDDMAETVAGIDAKAELRGKQLDLIYQAVVEKGMK
jgi:hypothetical protein